MNIKISNILKDNYPIPVTCCCLLELSFSNFSRIIGVTGALISLQTEGVEERLVYEDEEGGGGGGGGLGLRFFNVCKTKSKHYLQVLKCTQHVVKTTIHYS